MSDEIKALRAELDALTAGMKPIHLRMAQAMVSGRNNSEAYKDAGYKGKNPDSDAANVLRENPSISKYVDLAKKLANLEILPEKIATFEQKRKMLWEIATKSAMLQVTLKDGTAVGGIISTEEEPLQIFDASAAKTAVTAIAELNKMDGDLAAIKTENKHSIVQELTDEELDAKIAEKQRKLAGLN